MSSARAFLARPAQGEDGFEGGEQEVLRLNLDRELQICSRLPEASQNTYVESLKPVILSYFEMLQFTKRLSTTNTMIHLENEHELQLVEVLAFLKKQIFTSELTKEAKNCLDTYLDHLINTQTFQPKRTQPI